MQTSARRHTDRICSTVVASLALVLASVTVFPRAAVASATIPLVWYAEDENGRTLAEELPDRPVNPASVVKLVTTLRALEHLGPEHRFRTVFGRTGDASRSGLVVRGGADPDFHFENALLVAKALADAGVERIDDGIYVDSSFWMGWERGSAGREQNPHRRAIEMGTRLRRAWIPATWTAEEREIWGRVASERGWDREKPPSVQVSGETHTDSFPSRWTPLVEHRSEPLLVALRRFNVFSNNDIERLDVSTGTPSSLSGFLRDRLGEASSPTEFATSSGLGRNRMSPRTAVRVLRELRLLLERHGRGLEDVLPVLGCGRSTLPELFPRLHRSGEADAMAGKTGTLNTTDGGVAALAGYLPVSDGMYFFVAAPGAGAALSRARAAQERWVLDAVARFGPVARRPCASSVPTSDRLAEVQQMARGEGR